MATRVKTTLFYPNIYGLTLRTDGMVRRYTRRMTRQMVTQARRNVTGNSSARYVGYPRTGRLAASIGDDHLAATQSSVTRTVYAAASYAPFVHEGTRNNGTGRIYARSGGGRFGGRFPVGKSQGMPRNRRTLVAQVRGQRANPFLADASETVMRRFGM